MFISFTRHGVCPSECLPIIENGHHAFQTGINLVGACLQGRRLGNCVIRRVKRTGHSSSAVHVVCFQDLANIAVTPQGFIVYITCA